MQYADFSELLLIDFSLALTRSSSVHMSMCNLCVTTGRCYALITHWSRVANDTRKQKGDHLETTGHNVVIMWP